MRPPLVALPISCSMQAVAAVVITKLGLMCLLKSDPIPAAENSELAKSNQGRAGYMKRVKELR
jgi:hypothetical protein